MEKKKVVVFTGAGISAESGLKTFRDEDGLWEGHDVMKVASINGWNKNRELVLNFYNQRRKDVLNAQPNDAHKGLAELEEKYEVCIVTQNVDDLHERGGSKNIIHLHGEILKMRSSFNPHKIYPYDKDILVGDKCEHNSQLRPHIVWFGEQVPMMESALQQAETADIFVVIGTSLQVYPAANLLSVIDNSIKKIVIDKNIPDSIDTKKWTVINKTATEGIKDLLKILL